MLVLGPIFFTRDDAREHRVEAVCLRRQRSPIFEPLWFGIPAKEGVIDLPNSGREIQAGCCHQRLEFRTAAKSSKIVWGWHSAAFLLGTIFVTRDDARKH